MNTTKCKPQPPQPRPKTSYNPPLPPTTPPPLTFTVCKQYTYTQNDLIGQGISSRVYFGTCNLTKKAVSVKVIKKQQLKEKNILTTVRDQVKLLSKLKHQNVLALEAFEETDRCLTIVTEYCNGGDLEQMLRKKTKLPEYQALSILEDVIRGYGHLVSNNIVHRDIKPANIFLCNGRAKIADFGFAMLKNDVFAKNQAVGSPQYMPLESLQKSDFSHKSDIFAIGVVFYEILHGTMPWEATTQQELIYKLKFIQYKIGDMVSDKSKAFLKVALQTNVQKRIDEKELPIFFKKQRSKQLYKEHSALGLTPSKEQKIEPSKPISKDLSKTSLPDQSRRRVDSTQNQRIRNNIQKDILDSLPIPKTSKYYRNFPITPPTTHP